MTDDPLRDVFGHGSNPDPLGEVFGTPRAAPNPDWTSNPLHPSTPTPLVTAIEGGTPQQPAQPDLLDFLKQAPPVHTAPAAATTAPQSVPGYLAHGLESGIYSVGAGLGDVAESFNPVSAARNAWLTIKDAAHQALSGDLVGDRQAYMQTQAAKDGSTPFTRFADSMTRQAQDLGNTPDGARYNQLRYATTDPSQSALLSPVRMVHDLLQSLPSTAAMAATVYLTRGAATKAYSEAITAGFSRTDALAIATKAAGRVATLAGALGEGTVGGLQQGEQTRQQTLDGPMPTSRIYHAMVEAGVSPEDAKQYVAKEAGDVAGAGAGFVDALTNALEGPILGKIIGGEGGPLASRVLKGFAAEGTQEAVQGAGEQLSQNAAQKAYVDPKQALGDGVAENVIASFAVGGLSGGMFAGVGGAHHAEAPAATGVGAPAPMGMREGGALSANITPDDEASPLPTDLIVQGKMTVGAAQGTTQANQVLRASGMPDVGTRVDVSHNGRTQQGAVADAWTVNIAGQDSTGVKIRLDDGTMIEEPVATLHDMGVKVTPVVLPNGLPEQDVNDPVVQEFAGKGMATVSDAGNTSPLDPTVGAPEPGTVPSGRKNGPAFDFNKVADVVEGIESHHNAGAVSPKGATGSMQTMAGTLRDPGFGVTPAQNDSPEEMRRVGRDYLAAMMKRYPGDLDKALAAYNWGPGHVDDAVRTHGADWLAHAPEETQNYVDKAHMKLGGVGGVQGDLLGGPSRTGAEMDAKRTVEQQAQDNQETEAGDLMDDAHSILTADANDDQDHVAYNGGQLGAKLGTTITPAEAPDYARAVLAKHGDTTQGHALAGPQLDDNNVAFADHTGTLGIPRDQMPQIKAEHRGAMVNFLNARGITHQEETVPAHALKPSQTEFSPAKVQQAKEFTGGDRAILIDQNNHVVDGHHQYVAAHDRGQNVRAIRLNSTVQDISKQLQDMPSVETAGDNNPAKTGQKPDNNGIVSDQQSANQPLNSGQLAGEQPSKQDALKASMQSKREGQPFEPRLAAGVSRKDTFDIIRNAETAHPLLHLGDKTPTGWIQLNHTNGDGAIIVHANRDEARTFTGKGWAQYAHAYAIDHGEGAEPAPATKSEKPAKTSTAASPAGIEASREAGRQAFERGDKRVPPSFLPNGHHQAAWLEGWDKANLAAPVEHKSEGPPTTSDKSNAERAIDDPKIRREVLRSIASDKGGSDIHHTVLDEAVRRGLAEWQGSKRVLTEAGRAAAGLKAVDTSQPQSAESAPSAADRSDAGAEEPGQRSSSKPGYGASNKIFTSDAADKARALIRNKLRTQLNSGFDPELLAAGMQLAGFHIEAGARKFADLAKGIADDLGVSMAKLKPYLAAWYNGARDTLEGHGEDVSDMDGPGAVRAALSMIADSGKEEAANADQGNAPASPERQGSPAVQSTEPERTAGQLGERPSADSERAVRPADSGRGQATERSGAQPVREAGSRGTGDRAGDGRPDGRSPAAAAGTERAKQHSLSPVNFSIEPGALEEKRGPKQKARDNIAAIRLVKQIVAEDRFASPEEQAAIAKYVGWGGLKNVFPDTSGSYGKGFEDVGAELAEILTPEEYETARRSIQYAHFTSEKIVRSMWDAAQRLGFDGGSIFEPGMGTGNFPGMMPDALHGSSLYQGVEMDGVTAAIAKALYPKHGVTQADFTQYDAPRDAYRLVIGNPPFSETVVKADPAYRSLGLVLHDYFFAKSLDAVQPGGSLLFVTSTGTMNKIDTKAREYLAERAWLAGAIRLPGGAFAENAGTEVTTDIVALVKKLPGEERPSWAAPDSWVDTVEQDMPTKEGTTQKGQVSRYFAEHPEMVLGETGFFDRLWPGRIEVRSDGRDMNAALKEAMDRLPEIASRSGQLINSGNRNGADFDVPEAKNGSYYLKDGKLYQKQAGIGREIQTKGKGSKIGLTEPQQAIVRGLVPIRDHLRNVYKYDLLAAQAKGSRLELAKNTAESYRADFNKAYDEFVAKHGPINKGIFSPRRPNRVQIESARMRAREEARAQGHEWDDGTFDPSDLRDGGASIADIARIRAEMKAEYAAQGRPWSDGTFSDEEVPDTVIEKRPNIDPFKDDPESYRLRSIEHYDDQTGEAKKGRVFFESVIAREEEPDIKSTTDALFHVLNKSGRVDLDEIADLAGTSPADAATDLAGQVFHNPDTKAWEHSTVYLAGNVRQKLAEAREALRSDPRYQSNVDALEAAMPPELGKSDVRAVLGMPWIPAEDVKAFVAEELGLTDFHASYSPGLASWAVAGDKHSAASTSTYGTSRRSAVELMGDSLNGTTPKIFDTWRDETGTHSVLNTQETQAAQDKQQQIKQKFEDWLFKDDARADRLLKIYNERFNSFVAPEWNGEYLTTPGVTSSWNWRPHQKRGIARIVQSGNTYLAHAVGAGKTATMISSVMEMRRLGLVNKPMISVPNHMLGQFTKEFYELYPLAKLAIADEEQFHTDRRKQFISDVALNDLDGIVITHSAFGLIPMSPEFERRFLMNQLSELRSVLNEIKQSDEDGQTKNITRRKVEQSIEQAEQRMRAVTTRRRDQTFTFEQMGVDHLTVDEAHLFRKLDFTTRRGNIKGIDPNGSMRSMDLYMKSRYLEDRKPGRSLVLASGTPITNTMAELFTISRFLQPGELKARGIDKFDAWAASFGNTKSDLEPTAGGTYKMQTRFSEFVNVPELSVMARQVMDVVTSSQLEQYVVRPKVKRDLILVPQTPGQSSYQATLAKRMELIENRTGKPQKGDDIILTVIGDGRKSAIDMRLVNPGHDVETSKLERMIDEVHKEWEATKRQPFYGIKPDGYSAQPVSHGPAAQMIFSSLGVSDAMEFNVHRYIRDQLVKRGVPKDQIVLFNQIKSSVAKQKVFNDTNAGKVRILIGSVDKMGTGVNAQKRLSAINNLDPEWLPSSDEQRNGRGIRQGNTNREIKIKDYATKGTYDEQMWGIMARKARFIEGFFRGDPTLRTIEDLGEASTYEQAKALVAKDPRILELAQAKLELEKEIRRRNAHDQEQATAKRKAVYLKAEADAERARLALEEKDAAKTESIKGDDFKAVLNGKTFDDRGEFQTALDEARKADTLRRGINNVGTIGGHTLALLVHDEERTTFSKEDGTAEHGTVRTVDPALLLTNDPQAVEARYAKLADANTAVSAQAALEKIARRPDATKARIAQLEKQQADFEERARSIKPYEGLGRIAELQQETTRLTNELDSENKAAEARKRQPQVQSQSGARHVVELSPSDVERIRTRLLQRMAELGINDKVSLDAAYGLGLHRSDTLAQYNPWAKLISVALHKTRTPEHSLNHEAIHALRDLGLFTPEEWNVLVDEAWSDPDLRRWATTSPAYQDLPLVEQQEEAAAEFFADAVDHMRGLAYQGEPLGTFEGMMHRMIFRVTRVLNALRHAVSYITTGKAGDTRLADVIFAIDTGKVGARTPTVRGNRTTVTFGKKGVLSQGERPNRQMTLTPAFKAWFGKSKVEDENGRPKVVYHATTADFGEFSRTEDIGFHFGTGEAANSRLDQTRESPKKLPDEGENIMPVYLKIEHPLRLPDLNTWGPDDVIAALADAGVISDTEAEAAGGEEIGREWVQEKLAAKGYDGIVYKNTTEGLFRRYSTEPLEGVTVTPNEWLGKGAGPDKAFIARAENAIGQAYGRTEEEARQNLEDVTRREKRMTGDSYIVFSPEQIKSAIGNNGKFDPTNPDIRAQAAPPPRSEGLFPAGVEERWKDAAKGIGDGPGMFTKMNLAAQRIGQAFSRHWIDLPNVPKYAELQQELRKLEAAPAAAKERAVRHLRQVLKGMTREDMDLFTRKVVTDDLAWEADSEHDLPFGFTPETLADARKAIDAELAKKPEVLDAVRKRKALNRTIAQEMVDAGVLDAERLKNPNYYRHVVLDYARAEAAAARTPGVGKKLRSPRWARRLGSEKDINANYLEAEFDWMAKALVDIPTARAISWIGDSSHNILPPLREQAKAHNKEHMAQILEQERKEFGEEGGPVTEAQKAFKQRIAMGFKFVEDAIETSHMEIPPQLQKSFDAVAGGRGDPFPFLSWLLDNNQPGANGAAVILKAISQRRVFEAKVLGRHYIDPTDAEGLVKRLAPEGYSTWSPDDARLLFAVKTMPEHAIDAMLEKIDAAPGVSTDDVRAMIESVRSALAFGGMRHAMILPNEVASTLNQLRREDIRGLFDALASEPLKRWKQWVLINPRRVIKYNLNNLSGDLDAVLAGRGPFNRKFWSQVGPSAVELAQVMSGKAEPSARYEEAVERGVFDSGLSVQEIPDINRLSAFSNLTEGAGLRPDKVAAKVMSKAWNGLKGGTQWRENVLRYAAYREYVNRLEGGEDMLSVGYGGSVPQMVDAVKDPRDRAALLARDLVGDYGNVSRAGQEIRQKLLPFWSWLEINTKRYWRLSSNAFAEGTMKGVATGGLLGAGVALRTTAWLGMRMALMYGLLNLWNHMLWPDEEEKLGKEQQQQLHIIIGKRDDGSIETIRLQGALSDALSWFGLSDAADALHNWELGRGPWYDMLLAPAKATINKLGTGLSPLFTIPFESISGKKLYPDLFATRFIRDKWRNAFQSFSLENEYDWLLGKPSRGYSKSWLDSIVYDRDPNEIAYNEARGLTYDWLKRTKGQADSGGYQSDRANALYDWRAARKFQDSEAEKRAIDRLEELGVTRKDLKRSIKAADPLASIPKKDRRAFLGQLTDEELTTFERAEDFYRSRFLEGPAQ